MSISNPSASHPHPSSKYYFPSLFPLRSDPNGDVQTATQMSPIDPRDRDRDIDLDGTGSSYRRRYEDLHSSSHPPSPTRRVEVPLSLVITIAIYLVGQLVGGIWWAATLQADVQHEAADRAREEQKLWQKVELHDVQLAQTDKIVRAAVKEALMDAGIRTNRQREE